MVYSPCLHPVSVYNDTLGTTVSVPCGHCAACLAQKGYARKNRIEEVFLRYRYRYFVTLTFSDNNLPRAHFDESEMRVVSDCDVDYKNLPKSRSVEDFNHNDLEFIRKRVAEFGFLPILSHSYITNFKKRLRRYLNYYYGNQGKRNIDIFISVTGEYGPTTFRPHYHLLIGLDEDIGNDNFKQLVVKAWSPRTSSMYRNREGKFVCALGDVDFQRCYGDGSVNYCATYVSCTTNLPRIYAERPFSPFQSQGLQYDRFQVRQSLPQLREFFNSLPVSFDYVSPKSSEKICLPLPSWFKNRIFPRCPRYSKIARCNLYGVYSVSRKSCAASVRQFCEYVWSYWLAYKDASVKDADLSYLYWLFDVSNSDYETVNNNLVRLYYCSRRACRYAESLGITLSAYLERMVKFYSKLELKRLSDFYEFQLDLLEDSYHPVSLDGLFGLYKSTDFDRLKNLDYYREQFNFRSEPVIHQQLEYGDLMRKIVNDTTKTKKRNDYFNKRGLKRPVYMPRLSHKINHFLSI